MKRDRRPYAPRPVAVEVGSDGAPDAVGGFAVEAIREEWVVEDRWWTPHPLRRHYFELVLADGRDVSVFRDGREGRWYRQRA
jgi:KaiC/GvpD/RAD55 family RecA-like ATPase